MSFILYFPNSTTPTTTVVLPSPRPGFVPGAPVMYDNSFLTDGGTRYVYGKGVKRNLYAADFVITNAAVFAALVDFFENKAEGMVKTFDVQLPDLTTITGCRFTHSSLADRISQEKTNKFYKARLEIEK